MQVGHVNLFACCLTVSKDEIKLVSSKLNIIALKHHRTMLFVRLVESLVSSWPAPPRCINLELQAA